MTLMFISMLAAFAPPDGEAIYKSQCLRCHGAQGEGSKQAELKLEGTKSEAQLAKLIKETMPENKPGSLSDAEAAAVAQYIFENFYSPLAQERRRPPRIALARLTVAQHRNALADLFSDDQRQYRWDQRSGIKGEYFKGRFFNRNERADERIDANIDFEFKRDPPIPGKMEAGQFSIHWSGSILAPETGEYLIKVRTDHAVKVFLNDEKPLIDRWVKSGKDTDFTATIHLLQGRFYPIRVEFSKAKQGVTDDPNRNKKQPNVPAFISLQWQPPKGVLEPIPQRFLMPVPVQPSFVSTVPFPPDDRSFGWERGVVASREWDDAVAAAALEAGSYAEDRFRRITGIKPNEKDSKDRLKKFCVNFAERAFRRPLEAHEKAKYIEKPIEAHRELPKAFKEVVVRLLVSPHFLFREVDSQEDQFDVASRLAFALWDSIPDRKLREAAARGQLKDRNLLMAQAEDMLKDVRARAKIKRFLLGWSGAVHDRDLAKDTKLFPGFDARLIADMKTSLELFLEEQFWSEESSLEQTLTHDEVFLNQNLAQFFGVPMKGASGFTKVRMDDGKRAGILTHPYLLTTFSHAAASSPIHRGVFLVRGMLGISLRPPPEAVAPLAPDLHPTLTTRERVELQTKPHACTSCHNVINPLGFTLEHFDAVGRFRSEERGKKINAVGRHVQKNGQEVAVNGAKELAAFLSKADETYDAFASQMFHHLAQQPINAYGKTVSDQLLTRFRTRKNNMRQLATEIAVEVALKSRQSNQKLAGTSIRSRP